MFSSIYLLLLLFCCIIPFVQGRDKQKKKRDLFIHTVDDDKYRTRKVLWSSFGEERNSLLLEMKKLPRYILMEGK